MLLILDAFVELGLALLALGEEMEADALDMLAGLERFGSVNLVALDFQFLFFENRLSGCQNALLQRVCNLFEVVRG